MLCNPLHHLAMLLQLGLQKIVEQVVEIVFAVALYEYHALKTLGKNVCCKRA